MRLSSRKRIFGDDTLAMYTFLSSCIFYVLIGSCHGIIQGFIYPDFPCSKSHAVFAYLERHFIRWKGSRRLCGDKATHFHTLVGKLVLYNNSFVFYLKIALRVFRSTLKMNTKYFYESVISSRYFLNKFPITTAQIFMIFTFIHYTQVQFTGCISLGIVRQYVIYHFRDGCC